jgi:phospholipid-binding lipoprotein MlaA
MKSIMLRVCVLAPALLLAACSSTPPPKPETVYPEPVFAANRVVPAGSVPITEVYDPWEGMNKRIYNFNYHFDQWVFLPVVRGWQAVVPEFARTGVHNFFENFRDVRTMANSILQLSPQKFFESTGRVLVNSTVGLFGVIDVATAMDIPKPDEDFGQTLGYWGVGTGPYLVLPLLGPSNVRDGVGLYPDFVLQNYIQGDLLSKPLRASAFLFDSIDTRENTSFRYYETGSAFEYQTVRWLYSTKRELDVEK